MRPHPLALLLPCLVGCPGPAIVRPRGPALAELSLQVRVDDDGDPRGVRDLGLKDAVAMADRLALRVQSAHPVFVYLRRGCAADAPLLDGSIRDGTAVPASAPLHLPEGATLPVEQIAREPGPLTLCLLASARPLDPARLQAVLTRPPADPAVCPTLQEVLAQAARADAGRGEGTKSQDPGGRGYDARARLLRGCLDRDGVGVLRFPIEVR